MAASLAIIVATEFAAMGLTQLFSIPTLPMVGFTRTVQIAVLCWVVFKHEGSLRAIGWEPSSWITGLKKGALWSMGFGAIAGIAMLAIYLTGSNPLLMIKQKLPSNSFDLILYILIGGLIAPVAEEVCFRGILYTFFRRWGIIAAIIISTTIFVILHSFQGIPYTQIVGGVVFAIAYETSRNLMVPIFIHCTGNIAIFTLSLP